MRPTFKMLALTTFLALFLAAITHTPAEAAELERIEDISKVCMVNDRFMGSEQIAVEYEGKTYYGCCAGCVKKIRNNESIRYGTDPVSEKRVDKATAVVGSVPYGSVYYFENEENFNAYLEELKKNELQKKE